MTPLIINPKNFLNNRDHSLNIVFVFVLTCICLMAIKVGGHEASQVRDDASRVEPLTDRNENDVFAAIAEATGNTTADQTITKCLAKVKNKRENDAVWVHLGNAVMQKVRETGAETHYGHAEYVFRKALEISPKNIAATVGMSWVYGGRHQFRESIEWANKALALDPQNQDAHGLIGDAAVEFGDYDTAFDHYQKMLDIRPDLSSYSRAAHLLHLTGDVQKASLLMKKAINAGGPYAENTAWCRAQLALMLWNTGAISVAEQELEKAMEAAPANYYVLDAMGKVKSAKKDYNSAIEYYQKAVAITPNPKTLIALGDLYLLKGEKKKAEEQFQRVQGNNGHHYAHGQQGNIFLARFYADHDRNLPEALKEAEAAYRNSKNVFVTDTLAWCYYKNGRYDEALKVIQKALQWQTPDANILFHAGMIYAKLSNHSMAQKYLYQALSLNPNFHPVYSTVAVETLKQLGRKRVKS